MGASLRAGALTRAARHTGNEGRDGPGLPWKREWSPEERRFAVANGENDSTGSVRFLATGSNPRTAPGRTFSRTRPGDDLMTPFRSRQILIPATFALVGVVALSACGSDSKTSTSDSSSSTSSSSTAPAAKGVVKEADVGSVGKVLVTADGKTVYTLTKDGAAVDCTGGCLERVAAGDAPGRDRRCDRCKRPRHRDRRGRQAGHRRRASDLHLRAGHRGR